MKRAMIVIPAIREQFRVKRYGAGMETQKNDSYTPNRTRRTQKRRRPSTGERLSKDAEEAATAKKKKRTGTGTN